MPLQVLGIVGVVAAALSQIGIWLTGMATLKTACIVMFIAATVALTATFVTGITVAISTIVEVLPPEAIVFGAAIIPANLAICASSVVSARIARWVYDKNAATIKRICN